jgi:hypothetical protein
MFLSEPATLKQWIRALATAKLKTANSVTRLDGGSEFVSVKDDKQFKVGAATGSSASGHRLDTRGTNQS